MSTNIYANDNYYFIKNTENRHIQATAAPGKALIQPKQILSVSADLEIAANLVCERIRDLHKKGEQDISLLIAASYLERAIRAIRSDPHARDLMYPSSKL